MVAVAIAASVLGQAQFAATRYDLGERLKTLDVVWMATTDATRRQAAIPSIQRGVVSFFTSKYGEAARELDVAVGKLKNTTPSSGDAVTLRFVPAFAEPGKAATLRVNWAYTPADSRPISLVIGGVRRSITPGKPETLSVIPAKGAPDSPEGEVSREMGLLMSASVAGKSRYVYVSVVKNIKKRVTDLLVSSNSVSRSLAESMQAAIDKPDGLEQEVPFLDNITLAESLNDGRKQLWEVDHIPIATHGSTTFRAAFPRSAVVNPETAGPVNVVLAFHGAGGSENLFFEGYGRGAAVREALGRGWVFVAPRQGRTSGSDVIEWLTKERKLKIGKLFIMGHSAGGVAAVSSAALSPKPSAIALFAPAIAGLGADPIPTYLAVGKQENQALLNIAKSIADQSASRTDFRFEQIADSEHLMIVGDATKAAFEFFDRFSGG